MADDAGPGKKSTRALRPGARAVTVAAALLLLGGGTAVAVGLATQDADPPSPPVSASEPEVADGGTTVGALPAPSRSPSTRERSTSVPTESTSTAAVQPRVPPAEIRIPSIGVTSEVTVVGLNPDGTLEVPQPGPDYDKAAWYEGSPAPGQTGPSVIEGHVDSAENGPSVFYHLGRVATGDVVEITRDDGSVVTFVVYDVQAYPKDDFPTLTVYGNTNRPELRLITCGGPFDSTRGHYLDNTVVFARQA